MPVQPIREENLGFSKIPGVFTGNPGVAFSSFFGFEHVHTDAAMSCLSIETTGVTSEDLRFFAPKSRLASDLKPVIFFTGLHG